MRRGVIETEMHFFGLVRNGEAVVFRMDKAAIIATGRAELRINL